MTTDIKEPTVRECVQYIKEGSLTCESLVQQCLDNIDSTEPQIKAWAYLDAESALERARFLDQRRQHGFPIGPLHGIPIGIKDIVDTATMPTERGTSIYRGRQPDADAAVIEKLHEAGAIILGKTVSCEMAWMNESPTRNPHNLDRTPGGSSSGSAAAVAAGHVPLAIGSQTGGSVIRPASFNGVFGFKPSQGLISRRGVLQTSPSLDQLGVFGRDGEDVSLLVDVIAGFDPHDVLSKAYPQPEALKGYYSDVPAEPSLVWIDLPYADRYEASTKEAFDELLTVIDEDTKANLDRIDAPVSFQALIRCHQIINDYEILRCLDTEWNHHRNKMSESMCNGLRRAEGRTQDEYDEAVGIKSAAADWFNTFFHDYDAIVTPSAVSVAPTLGNGTGDPVCSVIWTLCGLPCVSLPLLSAQDQMPLGVQLVGAFERDDRLMRTTHWLLDQLHAVTDKHN
ncbi:MAG: Asp-tRNA(Asn)/Glu-tRNA(Gln) amidotransferase A subunit family amidase [Candidatus Azotimanducaceae bacterium]|jgi:Asp-tRNA(Asn)/Glu-tRNA(Gln) amidotransferase A subunit family amidase